MNRYLVGSAVVCAALAAFAALDPFHLRHAFAYTAATVLVALVLGTVLLVRVLRARWLKLVTGALGGLLVAGWIGYIALTLAFAGIGPETVVRSGGESGQVELVLVRGRAFDAPVYSVRLRTGGGPFAQESTVWEGVANGAAPRTVRLVGDDVAEVVAGERCGYRSTYDRTTLDAEPVNRPIRPDGC